MKIFTRLIPIARIYEFIDQITYAGEVYLATGDRTEYENQLERIRGEQEQMERELSDITQILYSKNSSSFKKNNELLDSKFSFYNKSYLYLKKV